MQWARRVCICYAVEWSKLQACTQMFVIMDLGIWFINRLFYLSLSQWDSSDIISSEVLLVPLNLSAWHFTVILCLQVVQLGNITAAFSLLHSNHIVLMHPISCDKFCCNKTLPSSSIFLKMSVLLKNSSYKCLFTALVLYEICIIIIIIIIVIFISKSKSNKNGKWFCFMDTFV